MLINALLNLENVKLNFISQKSFPNTTLQKVMVSKMSKKNRGTDSHSSNRTSTIHI